MFGESHDLPHEFPEYQDLIERLRASDIDFRHMYIEYHALDEEIRKIEQNVETVSDIYAEELKKKRVLLKDRIYQTLREQNAASPG
jgi:uncharacterized protein YdcH (DUF465 family)